MPAKKKKGKKAPKKSSPPPTADPSEQNLDQDEATPSAAAQNIDDTNSNAGVSMAGKSIAAS